MTDDDARFSHEVLRAIRQMVRRISEYSKQLSRDAGLSVPQLICLKAIGEAQGLTVQGLAERVQLSSATASRIVERLVRAGLVERARDTDDRRRVSLTLTTAGSARFDDLPTPLQESFVARLMELAPSERTSLLAALHRLTGLMEAAEIDAAPLLAPEADLGDGGI